MAGDDQAQGKSATIFDIADSVKTIEEMLGDESVSNESIREAFIAAKGALEQKTEDWLRYIRIVEGAAESSDLEAKRLKERSERLAYRAKRAKETLISVLDYVGKPVIDTGAYKVTVYDAGNRALWVDPDWSKLPEWATKEISTVKVDSEAIKARLDAGEDLGFANYKPAKRTMRVS